MTATPTTPPPAPARATWRDYVTLTKPKVISLLLLTTVGAMFIAANGFPGWVLLFGTMLGGYLSAGAAGVFNMVYGRGGTTGGQLRVARLTALITAFSEAVTMFASIPTPQNTSSPTAHSRYAAARASPPEDRACSW